MDDLGRSSEPNHTDLNDDVRRRAFARYIGVDYSGANTPTKSLKGLRVYCADVDGPPREVTPPTSPRKYWTRRGVAEWLGERLAEDIPTIVGIDHGFSFPEEYFDKYGLKGGWDEFLHDFHLHWQTDDDDANVKSLLAGNARVGDPRWKRLTERRAKDLCNRSAKSVFQFGVQGSVAHSTHAGIPWLIRIRTQLGPRVHFWPFDGWQVPSGRSAVVEVYPALWHRGQQEVVGLSDDQRDAYCIAMWLSDADRFGELAGALEPNLSPDDRALAGMEGWILGVPGSQG